MGGFSVRGDLDHLSSMSQYMVMELSRDTASFEIGPGRGWSFDCCPDDTDPKTRKASCPGPHTRLLGIQDPGDVGESARSTGQE